MYAEKTDYDDIEMSSRLRNVLRRNGFESLEELREYPKEHFIKLRYSFRGYGRFIFLERVIQEQRQCSSSNI